ncbi:SNF2 family helicase/ATPase [Paecilomyces variotii No. 5]|uniref:SNF2 family helicase/ATPase n=1 Tax=Byssochlamys spectabilis (strain No. 5 / NBRC 109023) TaxID=1356009 RepID=V5FV07_BYSSN|nr:SNF2 family helicase/ATPase [Paecilomyces variotii No. 5]
MSSHAAMLLDPRAFRKQQIANGNNREFPSSAHLTRGADNMRASSEPPVALPPSISLSHLEPLDQGIKQSDLHMEGKRQQDAASSVNPAAPAGTTSTAHQLLNPRGGVKSRPRARSHSNPPKSATESNITATKSTPAKPEMQFQFTTTEQNDSGDDSDGKRNFDQVENALVAGHKNLIEDMYGVERRSEQPQKRLKILKEQEEKPVANKKSNFSMSGNVGLGEWMKEDKETSDRSTAVTPDVVDLTLDSVSAAAADDDLQVTGANDLSNQRVCYGKIESASIQAHMVPKPSAKSIFGDSLHDWPSIRLGIHHQPSMGNRIEVSDPHNHVFGAVDAKTAAAIVPLLDTPALKVDISARLDVRKKSPDEWPWQQCSALYRASINLYGLRRNAELVGRHLGQHNVWLGTPSLVEQGVPVFNPHAERRRAQISHVPAAARGRPGVSYEVRTAEEVNNAVMKMFDQLKSADNIPEMEPSPLIVTPLLRHQKQALWYMTEKEKPRKFGPNEEDNNSLWRLEYRGNGVKRYREIITGMILSEEPPQTLGGLLADMMGLGKTLSILSLVMATLPESRNWEQMIPSADLVRGSPGIRNTRTTLLVSPLSAVNNWVTQIKEHLTEGAISYYVFHGPSRTTDVDELAKYDLVITTYSIVLSELSRRGSKRGVSPLTKMNMFRIVLDEAHTIREQNAAQTQAILRLNAARRWSVTGTPIQNRLEDLISVTKFLRLFPYDDRSTFSAAILSKFKSGDANVLASLRVFVDSFTLRRVKDKIDLPPRHDKIVSLTFSEKEKELHDFFKRESNVMMNVIAGESKTKMGGRMYHHVLKAMMILRQVSAHGKELLDKEDRERIKGLSVHDAIDLEEGANDPPAATDRKAYEMFSLMQDSSADICASCGKHLEEKYSETGAVDKKEPIAVVLPCFDVVCTDCFSAWKDLFHGQPDSSSVNQIRCPVCEGWIPSAYSTITPLGFQEYWETQAQAKQSRKHAKSLGEYEGPHTKTKALISHLLDTVEENKALGENERPIKSVIFSAWTSHLDLIEIALNDNGITGYTRLDGTMSLAARNKALNTFRDDDRITILLATIGAGGVGLNLTSASKVYVMEPQYNPAAVAQAVDRVHRLGQTREVTTIQFIMKDSIEEKIAELAKRKQQLADMSMNRGRIDKKDVQEQRMREYRSLFK